MSQSIINIGKYQLQYRPQTYLLEGVSIHNIAVMDGPVLHALKSEQCLDALTEEEIDGTIGMICSETRRSIQQAEALLSKQVAALQARR